MCVGVQPLQYWNEHTSSYFLHCSRSSTVEDWCSDACHLTEKSWILSNSVYSAYDWIHAPFFHAHTRPENAFVHRCAVTVTNNEPQFWHNYYGLFDSLVFFFKRWIKKFLLLTNLINTKKTLIRFQHLLMHFLTIVRGILGVQTSWNTSGQNFAQILILLWLRLWRMKLWRLTKCRVLLENTGMFTITHLFLVFFPPFSTSILLI